MNEELIPNWIMKQEIAKRIGISPAALSHKLKNKYGQRITENDQHKILHARMAMAYELIEANKFFEKKIKKDIQAKNK